MHCWKCGAQTVEGACLMCGCEQGSRKPAVTEAGSRLRYVYDKFGGDRVLREEGLLIRCLPDMLPDEIELRQSLKRAFEAGAGQALYTALTREQTLDEAAFQGVVNCLRAAALNDDEAREVLVALWDMVGCGTPGGSGNANASAPAHIPADPAPSRHDAPADRREISKCGVPANGQREISQKEARQVPVPPPGERICELCGVEMADATHGLNAFKSNGRSGVLKLRQDGVAMHYYEGRIFGKKRAYHPLPDIFIPLQAIARLVEHDSGLSYDFTLVLQDGVRFQVIASTFGYNRKEAKGFVDSLKSMIR